MPALAFLGPAEIAELEKMKACETAPFGPTAASAHFKDQSHYHHFYNCSYVYQQGGTYGVSWYMCPQDTANDRFLGDAIGVALGVWGPTPLFRFLGGMLIAANHIYFYEPDGSLRGSLSDYRAVCGWLRWGYPITNHWMYYYCVGSEWFNYGYSDYWSKFFYVKNN
jgi:hypothetical protein